MNDEIRPFPDSKLKASIDAVLARVPADVPYAVVAHADLREGVAASAFVRLGDQFSFTGTFEKRPDMKLSVSAELLWYPGYKR